MTSTAEFVEWLGGKSSTSPPPGLSTLAPAEVQRDALVGAESRTTLQVARLRARYPLPSEMRGELAPQPVREAKDLIANLRRRYPTPSELREQQLRARIAREMANEEVTG